MASVGEILRTIRSRRTELAGLDSASAPSAQGQKKWAPLIVGDAKLTSFLRDHLSVTAGLYAVADLQQDAYVTLQTSRYNEDHCFPVVDFPRAHMLLPGGESVDPCFTDFLFLLFRRRRSLRQSPPEFLAGPRAEGDDSWRTRSSEAERRLRDADSSVLLYVDASEMSFFLFAWRLLVRVAAERGANARIGAPSELRPDGEPPVQYNIWDACCWRHLPQYIEAALSECRLLSSLATLQERLSSGTLRAPNVAFISECLNEWWPKVTGAIDRPLLWEGPGLRGDLILLGMLETDSGQYRVTRAFHEMIRYAAAAAAFADVARSSGALSASIQELERFIAQGDAVAYSDFAGGPAEAALLQVIYFLLCSTPSVSGGASNPAATNGTVADLLLELHRLARFLIIPYFYQCALARTLMEHLVLGVWESFSNPIVWRERAIPQAVQAMVGLMPWWRWPLMRGGSGRFEDRIEFSLDHILTLQAFLAEAAYPIIDEGFYGGLIRKAAFEKGHDEARRAFGHEIKRFATALTSQWVLPAAELFVLQNGRQEQPQEGNKKVGVITIDKEFGWLGTHLAVVPFPDLVASAGDTMKLWAMTQSHAELPLQRSERTHEVVSFQRFVDACLSFARSTAAPFALANEKRPCADNISYFRDLLQRFTSLLAQQKLVVSLEPGCGLEEVGIRSSNSRDTIWLCRILVALFGDCIRHGDLLQPVIVDVRSGSAARRYRITVSNAARPRKLKLVRDQLEQLYQEEVASGQVTKVHLDSLAICLNSLSQSSPVFEETRRPLSHTAHVLGMCLTRLDGGLIGKPGTKGGNGDVRTEFECRYELGELSTEGSS